MSSEFVATKKVLKGVTNGRGPQCTYLSVVGDGDGQINLVIGAKYEHRCAAILNRRGLAELIELLKEIHEVM